MVYVGRICGSMTHDELRQRFLQFGQVECVALHFRETGSVCTGGLSTRRADRSANCVLPFTATTTVLSPSTT